MHYILICANLCIKQPLRQVGESEDVFGEFRDKQLIKSEAGGVRSYRNFLADQGSLRIK
jgi:hypothetical protein